MEANSLLNCNVREATESLERKFQQISLNTKKEDPSPSVEKKTLGGKSSIPSQDQEDSKTGDLYCEVCQKTFTGEQSQLEHMKSEKHLRKVGRSVAPENTNTLDKQVSMELYCELCQKSFTGAESMREHEQSQKHRRKVEALNTEDLNCEKVVNVSAPLNSVDEKQSSGAKECKLCQKTFSGQQSMEEHLNSQKHLKKLSQARLGSLRALECQPCKKVFSGQESLEEHLKSKKHLSMVK